MIEIDNLADVFVEVADTLVAGFDLIEFLHTVAQHAADVSGGAVGLVLADEHGQLHYMSASGDVARELELLQLDLGEGPCLDCFRSGEVVIDTDLVRAEAQWPHFAPLAVGKGVRSVHAFPMRLRDRVIGALNVFGTEAQVLEPDEARVVQALADVATISIIQEQAIARAEVVTEQLQAALNSRIVVEQAKGAVARALGISVNEAFVLLRERARHTRTPLTGLAYDLVNAPETIEDRLRRE
ncbi:ANTAR domain-containing protein [Nocardioides oleivorans]|uniref:ANTAR domain-containing protein n=1 Tax=Nocardioides oleivorans TaxID=273676 RepID=A0A4Q2RZ73_9ACTN|nr:GAF and ANTAR domain-containing protein [Nocardioides oleivorans]RYB94497.1 ANTAR domain-containing protein [Nocardioides oleivorans]